MKTKYLVLCFVIAFAVCLTSDFYAGDKDKIRTQIKELNKKMAEDFEKGDMESSLNLYTADAINLPMYSKMNRGIEEIKAHHKESMANMPKFSNVNFETVEVLGEGDLFVEIGKYSMTMEMKDSDQPMTDTGKYVTVWQRMPDGSLKIKADTWNTDTNYTQMAGQNDNKDMDKEMIGGEKDKDK